MSSAMSVSSSARGERESWSAVGVARIVDVGFVSIDEASPSTSIDVFALFVVTSGKEHI